MASTSTTAHNNSNGRQNLAFNNGDMNSVSDNGVQLNYHNHNTAVTMPPEVWPLVQELINSRKSDKESYHAILAKWLTQQSGQPSVAPRHHHLDLLSQATPGTGKWVLSRDEFQRWEDASSPFRFLFMSGTLGSGKSMLISIIIDYLEKQHRQRKDTICVYLFFHEKDAAAPLATSIWANPILQLLQKQAPGGIADELTSEFNDCVQGSEPLHPSRYFELFKAQASAFKTVYLIIDGLDNCPHSPYESTQQQVLNAIKDLPTNVRTLVSWRIGLEIHHPEASQRLPVVPEKCDIAAYVKSRIEGDANLYSVLKEHKKIDWVTKSVIDMTSASRMFLLARLHMDTLSKCGTMENIKEALSKLPDNWDNAFEGAMKQILRKHGFDKELASHVITWIIHAKVDLTITQIQDSFAFHKSNGNSWQGNRPPKGSLVRVCAGLVVEDSDKGTLRLVHESVKRRLKDGIMYKNPHLAIAKTCLSCLRADTPDNNSETPLLQYASNHWAYHWHDSQDKDSEVHRQIKKFLSSEEKLMRAFRMIPDAPGRTVEGMTSLHAAVFYNLGAQAKRLIKTDVKLDAQCSDGQTALHWAATLGRGRLVKYLVRKDPVDKNPVREVANPNIQDASGDTPIHKCLSRPTLSNLEIVKSLLKAGAQLNVTGAKGLTPLSQVIRYGPTAVAKLLIESQADVNAEATTGWTSLRELFCHGHEMETKFEESPRNTQNSSVHGWRPLKRAIDSHVHVLMQLLFDKGVDLNLPTKKDNWLPLIHAVNTGRTNTVQRLLERKPNPANVNLQDPNTGLSPLCLALRYKKRVIAKQLIEYGSDLSGGNGDRQTPLIEAVKNDDRDSVSLLIKKKALPNIVDRNKWSALHYAVNGRACLEGNISHVRFLLDMGSKTDLKDATKSTPLHHAVLQGPDDVVNLLASRVSQAVGLDQQDDKNNTALILATILKRQKMVDSLLHYGASCDVIGQDGLTALHRATNLGFSDGLKLMVANTNNIDLADSEGYTALHHAVNSEDSNIDIIDILYPIKGRASTMIKNTFPTY
ncbi:hypothetical protein CEP53_005404 [Fusarium sp. AF-6]|nr:hypothetical protein CEP53_005404 [Fusarium sp. AF-6]